MIALAPYVGTPYSRRMDCYALVRRVLADAGVSLPDYRYSHKGRAEFVATVRSEWKQVDRPRLLDVVLVNIKGRPTHVGIVAGRGVMLHNCADRGKAVIDRIDDGIWQVEGYFRWQA